MFKKYVDKTIKDAYFDDTRIDEDVYFQYEDEKSDHFQNVGRIYEIYTNGARTVLIVITDDFYSVMVFKGDTFVESKEFYEYVNAKKQFLESI